MRKQMGLEDNGDTQVAPLLRDRAPARRAGEQRPRTNSPANPKQMRIHTIV